MLEDVNILKERFKNQSGHTGTIWGKCIIKPIAKSSALDPRDLLSYQGIALPLSFYEVLWPKLSLIGCSI